MRFIMRFAVWLLFVSCTTNVGRAQRYPVVVVGDTEVVAGFIDPDQSHCFGKILSLTTALSPSPFIWAQNPLASTRFVASVPGLYLDTALYAILGAGWKGCLYDYDVKQSASAVAIPDTFIRIRPRAWTADLLADSLKHWSGHSMLRVSNETKEAKYLKIVGIDSFEVLADSLVIAPGTSRIDWPVTFISHFGPAPNQHALEVTKQLRIRVQQANIDSVYTQWVTLRLAPAPPLNLHVSVVRTDSVPHIPVGSIGADTVRLIADAGVRVDPPLVVRYPFSTTTLQWGDTTEIIVSCDSREAGVYQENLTCYYHYRTYDGDSLAQSVTCPIKAVVIGSEPAIYWEKGNAVTGVRRLAADSNALLILQDSLSYSTDLGATWMPLPGQILKDYLTSTMVFADANQPLDMTTVVRQWHSDTKNISYKNITHDFLTRSIPAHGYDCQATTAITGVSHSFIFGSGTVQCWSSAGSEQIINNRYWYLNGAAVESLDANPAQSMTASVPSAPIGSWIDYVQLGANEYVVAGSELGVRHTTDHGLSWHGMNSGLPPAYPIRGIALGPGRRIVIATDSFLYWSPAFASVAQNVGFSTISLRIYPTPSRGPAYLEVTSALNHESAIMTVYDAVGRLVERRTIPHLSVGIQSYPLPTNNLPAGRYLVRLQAGGASAMITTILE